MRERRFAPAAALLALATLGAAPPATVDELVARHIEARGGAERWSRVKSLKLTGTMTSWSRKSPFTLLRAPGDRYLLEGTQNGARLVIGYDGRTAWWDNAMLQEGAQRIRGLDLAVVLRDTDFPNPLFGWKEKGYQLRLLGAREFEGERALALELSRLDGMSETWYLDPATYLEVARESPGSDFGRPVPQRTFFADFRDVGGVKVPFSVESQWYTRDRALQADRAELDVPAGDDRFTMPPPPGMADLLSLAGEWKVAVSRSEGPPGSPWKDEERSCRIESLMGGALLQERFVSSSGNAVLRSITFDRFKKRYRVTEINEATTHLDVAEGAFDESKRLVVDNLKADTATQAFGMTFHGRFTIHDIGPDSFKTEEEYSVDAGASWIPAVRCVYTRVKG
ncbi:MAG TPA: DUF1579 family protein [Candidatus Polarisedimenticolia bacterium]|nr:DUF1579 family protein [Candidatus Polarisedimenticolia bacterium]